MNYRLVKSVCGTKSNKLLLRRLAPAILTLLAMVSFAHADIIVSHTGSANPTTEGWSAGGGGALGPGGTDTEPYWDITTSASEPTVDGYYNYTLSSGDVSGNWLFEAKVKVPTLTSGAWGPSDAYLNVYVGTSWYFVGLNDAGLYQSIDGGGYTNQLYGFTPNPSTYYTLSMKQTGAGVDIYVDGILKAGNITPRTGANYGNLLYWGDGGPNSGQAGHSHWSAVVFDTNGTPVPEPTSLTLLASAMIGLLCYAWKRRK